MEYIDRETSNYSEENLSYCHFSNHKSHMNFPVIEPVPSQWKAND
jgi:hypothetical protein